MEREVTCQRCHITYKQGCLNVCPFCPMEREVTCQRCHKTYRQGCLLFCPFCLNKN